jgi:hypothetical protein
MALAPDRWREQTGETRDPKYVQPSPG